MIFAPFIEILLPFILIITGTWQTFFYFRMKKHFEKWPVVAAEIVHSHLFNIPGKYFSRQYEAIIHFKYSFRGKEYVSEYPFLQGYMLFSNHDKEHEMLEKYKVGDITKARVHPREPRIAYLDVKPFHWLSAALVPIGAIMYVLFLTGYITMVMSLFE